MTPDAQMYERIKALVEAATPGPWYSYSAGDSLSVNPNRVHCVTGPRYLAGDHFEGFTEQDAAFIATLPDIATFAMKQYEAREKEGNHTALLEHYQQRLIGVILMLLGEVEGATSYGKEYFNDQVNAVLAMKPTAGTSDMG